MTTEPIMGGMYIHRKSGCMGILIDHSNNKSRLKFYILKVHMKLLAYAYIDIEDEAHFQFMKKRLHLDEGKYASFVTKWYPRKEVEFYKKLNE